MVARVPEWAGAHVALAHAAEESPVILGRETFAIEYLQHVKGLDLQQAGNVNSGVFAAAIFGAGWLVEGRAPERLAMSCSGKHAAMLAACMGTFLRVLPDQTRSRVPAAARLLPPPAGESYLNVPNIISAAEIASAVKAALDRTGAVITTGGLGPTSDDMTKSSIAAIFGRAMIRDEAIDIVNAVEMAKSMGPVRVLVNSAGMREIVPVLELSFEEWQRIITVNLTGTFHTLKATVPVLIKQGRGGSIVVTSSREGEGKSTVAAELAEAFATPQSCQPSCVSTMSWVTITPLGLPVEPDVKMT